MVVAKPVVVVGAGGLGCPVALALAEAGLPLRLIDDDVVELSNLQRQVLYGTADLGRPKVEVARERLVHLTTIETRRARLDALNADDLLGGAALVVDATDDPAARFVINDWAVAEGVPAVLGGIHRFRGLVMGISSGSSCFRCLFEEDQQGLAPSCAQVGVLGALAGLVGHLEAERALALLRGEPVTGFVTTVDGARTRDVKVAKADDCPACSSGSTRLARPSNVLTLAAF